MYDEYLTTTLRKLPGARCPRQQPNKVGGGSWWRGWPRQSQGHEEDQFTSASEDDWLGKVRATGQSASWAEGDERRV